MHLRLPDNITVFTRIDRGHTFTGAAEITCEGATLTLTAENDSLLLRLTADKTSLFHVRLRWNFASDELRHNVRVFGDTWERAYGDLEWRGVIPQRFMPWYMLVSDGSDSDPDPSGRLTEAFGIDTQPSAICAWQYDTRGVTLWADVRCGGDGVILGGRQLDVCRIRFREYRDISAFAAGRAFCREMCPHPLLPASLIYGSNNWYYAVGNSSHEQIVGDARLISRLSEGITPRPYMVIDDGWQANPCDGPFDRGGKCFPDMARLADDISTAGAIPGIWIRPLADGHHVLPTQWHLGCRPDALDPSVPEVLDYVRETVSRIRDWGYRLIKHDFTVFDMFGAYGSTMTTHMAENGWSFADRSRTSAEIALALYRTILYAAGDAVIIACNTLSHLTAGLAHLMRTGFDTSGRHFERTRICGVNALSHRMIQNGIFYMCDADCCSHTGRIDWTKNREWLRALSESGTPLFVSVNPGALSDDEEEDIRAALRLAAAKRSPDSMVPLDWMDTVCPERYSVCGSDRTYDWFGEFGTEQFIPPDRPEYM